MISKKDVRLDYSILAPLPLRQLVLTQKIIFGLQMLIHGILEYTFAPVHYCETQMNIINVHSCYIGKTQLSQVKQLKPFKTHPLVHPC